MIKKVILITGILTCLLSIFQQVNAQSSLIIKGKIIDKSTNETMPFVNVVEIDTKGRFISGTVSDINGNYILKIKDVTDSIQVSFIGYKKYVFAINGRTKINVDLEQESQTLQEVKIVASKVSNDGITQVRDRATAVTRMELKEMKSVMSTTVEEMMQGRLGNVDISSVSGDPGAGLNIRIRGTASLNAKNNPLIVVNGIPYTADFSNFDFASADVEKFGNLIDVSPEDIESIEVLKDAASTAVWGSAAANGVLMIKTKRGIKSKPIFEYTYKLTRAQEPDPLPMLDGAGYSRLIREEYYNLTSNANGTTETIPAELLEEIAFNSSDANYYNFNQNTNWVKEITRIAFTNQHDFSVRGGGEKSKYNMSVGYFDEEGTTIGNELKKLNLRSSLDYDLSSKLQFRTDIMYTRYDQDATYDAEDNVFSNWGWKSVRAVAYRKMPNMSVYDRDTNNISHGDYFLPYETLNGLAKDSYNPVAFANLGVNKKIKDNARSLFSIKYTIIPSLVLNSTVTLDIFDSKQTKFLPYKAIGFSYYDDLSNHSYNEYNKKSSIFTKNQLIYTPELNANNELTFLGQYDTEETVERNLNIQTSQSASPLLQQPTGNKHLSYIKSGFSKYRSLGMFLSANYKFKDKYLLMVGAKGEGTSKFSPESRWGIFPTTSVGWRISNEGIIKNNLGFIDDLLLRASWGQSGNLPDGNYLYFNTYKAGSDVSYIDLQGVKPNGIELTSLKWETIEQTNLGLTFDGFGERVNIIFDVYLKKTLDLYLPDAKIPTTSGFSRINLNDGEMENRGLEFSLDYKIFQTSDWEIAFNCNFSRNQNTVIRLPDNYSMETGDVLKNGEYRISVQPGVPLGGFYGYKYLGVYPTDADAVVTDENGKPVLGLNGAPLNMTMGGTSGYAFVGGDAQYQDVNHDGKIDALDIVYLGDLNPKYFGGGGLRIKYKNVVVNSFFNFKYGSKIINQTRMDTEKMYETDNQSTATNWRWRNQGDITDMPRALYRAGFNWLGSDRFVEDGSFIRLKTLSFTYNFNEKFCQKIKVKDCKVFATGYNLYTWTRYSGQDPDVPLPSKPDELPKDYSRTPPAMKVMMGLNVTF